jgi:hypothetical protein
VIWPVYIESVACDDDLVARVVSFARVELGDSLVDAPPLGPSCHVRLECSGQVVVIGATLPGRAPESQRADLTHAAESVRPRIIALTIAEVVRDLERDLEQRAPARSPVQAPVSAQRKPAHTTKHVLLRGFATGTSFASAGWLAGGGVGVEVASRSFFTGADVALTTRADAAALGNVRTLLFYGSPELGAVLWKNADSVIHLGVGFALGIARVVGHATATSAIANTLTGAWGGPFAGAGVGFALGDRVRLELRAKIGWVALPVVADVAEAAPVRLEQTWSAIELGAALFP